MNSKHSKTLKAVFTEPVSGTIAWADIESLLGAAGRAVSPQAAALSPARNRALASPSASSASSPA